MTEREVAKVLVDWRGRWPFRQYLVVPNTNQFLYYEVDLLIMTKSGFLTEIEIKVTKSDLKKDLKKRHKHSDPRVKSLWFAGPRDLTDALLEYAPERAGIIVVYEVPRHEWGVTMQAETDELVWIFEEIRKPKSNKHAPRMGIEMQYKLARLGAIRYWTTVTG